MGAILATGAWALALTLCVPGLRGRPLRALAAVGMAAALLHLPLAGTTLLATLRGLFAEPALTTVVVLAALLLARVGGAVPIRFDGLERRLVAVLAVAVGLVFYPPALGLGPVDPYAWGYGGALLPLGVGGVAMLACVGGCPVLALALAAALAGWRLHWLASPNLWDYLIDPLLVLGALLALLGAAARSAYRAMRTPAAARSTAKAPEAR